MTSQLNAQRRAAYSSGPRGRLGDMFSAPAGAGGRRRLSGLLIVDSCVAVLAGLDLAAGVWHELQEGKAAAGPAATGFLGGTSATVYFGALCLCWDDGLSPRRLLLLFGSFLALVGSALLGAQLECLGAPRIAATCAFLAFAALRFCPFDALGGASGGAAAPAAPAAAPRAAASSDAAAAPAPPELSREEVLAEVRRIYRKAAPDKAQSAVELIERYPPQQWQQMLRLIRHKYGEDLETMIHAKTVAGRIAKTIHNNPAAVPTTTAARSISASQEASAPAAPAAQGSGVGEPEPERHNRLGRALALLLPICALFLCNGAETFFFAPVYTFN